MNNLKSRQAKEKRQKTNKTPWYPNIYLIEENIIGDKKKFLELVYSKLQ